MRPISSTLKKYNMTIRELKQQIILSIMFLNRYDEDHNYDNLIRVFSILKDIDEDEITLKP